MTQIWDRYLHFSRYLTCGSKSPVPNDLHRAGFVFWCYLNPQVQIQVTHRSTRAQPYAHVCIAGQLVSRAQMCEKREVSWGLIRASNCHKGTASLGDRWIQNWAHRTDRIRTAPRTKKLWENLISGENRGMKIVGRKHRHHSTEPSLLESFRKAGVTYLLRILG